MDKKVVGKYLMMALGAALTLGSSLVSAKTQEAQMEETVAKKVAEELAKKASKN